MVLLTVQLVLLLLIYLFMYRPLYVDEEYTERFKLPLWVYIIFIVCAFIPILGCVSAGVAIILLILLLTNECFDTDWIYYKVNDTFKFLNKKF